MEIPVLSNLTGSKSDCYFCGKPLQYFSAPAEMQCRVCANLFQADCSCTSGHFICDNCHGSTAAEQIFRYALASAKSDPILMAQECMEFPSVHLHGPEHHFLVPAVLIAAYCNIKGITEETKSTFLINARKRAEKVPGGICGLHGNCGAAVGTGIFMSVITGTTPLSGNTWRQCNLITAHALMSVAEHGGPRCCKRDTYLAITEAVKFTERELGVSLPASTDITCMHSTLNRECLLEKCLFFPV